MKFVCERKNNRKIPVLREKFLYKKIEKFHFAAACYHAPVKPAPDTLIGIEREGNGGYYRVKMPA
jgi:hypothetical protein